MLAAGAELLGPLAAAHPALLLRCDSLPLLVHAAKQRAYRASVDSVLRGGRAGVQLQRSMEGLLSQLQQAAMSGAAGAEGAAALAM